MKYNNGDYVSVGDFNINLMENIDDDKFKTTEYGFSSLINNPTGYS